MSSAISPYDLRSRKTQPKILINHFDLAEIAKVKAQANEWNAFKQAVQAIESKNKMSRIASITLLVPRVAESSLLPPGPQLQDFSHIVIPLSDIRSQLLNLDAIADDHAYWDTLNIPVLNQDHAKPRKSSVHPTAQPTTKRSVTKTLAVTRPTRPRPYRRTRTPVTVNLSPPLSSSGSDLSSVDESILADTPEAFQDTASTAFTSSPSCTPKERCPPPRLPRGPKLGFFVVPAKVRRPPPRLPRGPRLGFFVVPAKGRRPPPRLPRGPRLGFFVVPVNAEAPLFDYCAAACELSEHKLRMEREAAARRPHGDLQSTIPKAIKCVVQTPVEATALAVNREGRELPQALEQSTAWVIDQQGVDITPAPNQATTTANDHEDKETSQAHNQFTAHEDGEDALRDGDLRDIDEQDTAGLTQPSRLLMPQSENPPARQSLRASATRPVPPLRHHQPPWHQMQPRPHDEQFQKRKRITEDGKDVSIQDVLQREVKKARKDKRPIPTATSAPGLAGTRKSADWRKGILESVAEADAFNKNR